MSWIIEYGKREEDDEDPQYRATGPHEYGASTADPMAAYRYDAKEEADAVIAARISRHGTRSIDLVDLVLQGKIKL